MLATGSEFQEKVRQLGQLITQFDQMPDTPQKTACKQLVQLLMDVHGVGLERIMEIIFESSANGPAIIDELARDTITSSLLLLYSLHPDDLETRINKAIERLRPRLRKLSCSVELGRISEGAVQIRVTTSVHSCGSSTKDVRTILEEGVYELAPDVASLEILGLEEPSASGFVALNSLIGHNLAAAAHNVPVLHTEGAD
jgi:Fe-S cluster biogenesis protein NfuA